MSCQRHLFRAVIGLLHPRVVSFGLLEDGDVSVSVKFRFARHSSAEADVHPGFSPAIESRGLLQPETPNRRTAVGQHSNRTGGIFQGCGTGNRHHID